MNGTMEHRKNSHCSYCGTRFPSELFPQKCKKCGQTTYLNPLPVAAVLLPVGDALLTVRRDIDPGKGLLTFPGGFINHGESWQQAAARELYEEAGIHLDDPGELEVFDVLSTSKGHMVTIFGLARPRTLADLPDFVPTEEASERCFLRGPAQLAFPQDTLVAQRYFARWRPEAVASK